ncbi:MAG: hypothetical protein F7C37_06470 [Desulfurococcales archaeon]|nr:hypothetical protein [Desulfurococcales archaeon]
MNGQEPSGLIELVLGIGGAVLAVLTYYWNVYRSLLELYGTCIKIKSVAADELSGRDIKLKNIEKLKPLACLDCRWIEDEISESRFNVGVAIGFALALFILGIITRDYYVASYYAVLSIAIMLAVLWRSSGSLVYYRRDLAAAEAVLDQLSKQDTAQWEGQT